MKIQKKSGLKEFFRSIFCFSILCFSMIMLYKSNANAAEQTVPVNNGDSLTVEVHPGDTGLIAPNAATADLPDDFTDIPDEDDWYDDWRYYSFDSQDIRFEYSLDMDEEQVVTVDEAGRYRILESLGRQYVRIIGRNSGEQEVFQATVCFESYADMTDVTLEKTKLTGCLVASYDDGDYVYYKDAELDVRLNSAVVLSEDMFGVDLDCRSSSKNVGVYASLTDNVLRLTVSGDKKCTVVLTVTIAGKEFELTVSLKPVRISTNAVLLEKGKTKQLKVRNWPDGVKWSSSNANVCSVSKSGVVKGKKGGNAVITAKIGDGQVGCAVSVVSAKLKKVCKRGAYIGANWKYSQPKRTQTGYYDCSALVWKAYKACAGLDFGNAYYPGTTVTESAWCRDHNRIVKGGYTYKKVQKMQLIPGDIVFKSENLKKPYDTTYHVEMFTGYMCTGFDQKGKPQLTTLWAARGAGYGAEDGSLLGRPLK